MMSRTLKSGDEVAEIVRMILVSSGIKASVGLTGGIYAINRPDNSKKEDVVVKCLALGAMQMQEGVINVNVHVPSIDAGTDGYQPNRNRFKTIGDAVVNKLDDTWGYDYNFLLDEAPQTQPDLIEGRWYLNVRIRFYATRLDNESIN